MKLEAAIRMGAGNVPELSQFLLEREMWSQFGTRMSPEQADDWPWRKVEDYHLIISLIRREEQARMTRARAS